MQTKKKQIKKASILKQTRKKNVKQYKVSKFKQINHNTDTQFHSPFSTLFDATLQKLVTLFDYKTCFECYFSKLLFFTNKKTQIQYQQIRYYNMKIQKKNIPIIDKQCITLSAPLETINNPEVGTNTDSSL